MSQCNGACKFTFPRKQIRCREQPVASSMSSNTVRAVATCQLTYPRKGHCCHLGGCCRGCGCNNGDNNGQCGERTGRERGTPRRRDLPTFTGYVRARTMQCIRSHIHVVDTHHDRRRDGAGCTLLSHWVCVLSSQPGQTQPSQPKPSVLTHSPPMQCCRMEFTVDRILKGIVSLRRSDHLETQAQASSQHHHAMASRQEWTVVELGCGDTSSTWWAAPVIHLMSTTYVTMA